MRGIALLMLCLLSVVVFCESHAIREILLPVVVVKTNDNPTPPTVATPPTIPTPGTPSQTPPTPPTPPGSTTIPTPPTVSTIKTSTQASTTVTGPPVPPTPKPTAGPIPTPPSGL